MPNPDKPRDRPTVPAVLPLVRAIYDRPDGVCGCCAHIVVDDGNEDQHCADFCLMLAREQGHADCIALCEALVLMTPTQRHQLYVQK